MLLLCFRIMLSKSIVARTRFVCKFAVSVYRNRTKLFAKFCNKLHDSLFLFDGACVARLPFGVKTANIADADRVLVMIERVRSNSFNRSALVHRAVKVNYEMITDVRPVALLVPASDLLHCHRHTSLGCRAVDNDFINLSHDCLIYSEYTSLLIF